MNNTLKYVVVLALVLGVILSGCAIGYYFVIYMPQHNERVLLEQKNEADYQRQQEEATQDRLDEAKRLQDRRDREAELEIQNSQRDYDTCVLEGWLALGKANPQQDPIKLKEIAEEACSLL